MFKATSIQMVTALMEKTRLKEKEGLLLAVYPDFILAVRPGMDESERGAAADALLEAAEDLSLPVMEDPIMDESENEDKSGLSIPPNLLRKAGFLGLNYDADLIFTVENGRIIIETEDE